MNAPVRVLVADGSAAVREWLTGALTAQGLTVVGAASDGHQAVALARMLLPDVVLLDELVPRLDGVSAARRIMATAPARVLLVTGAGGEARGRLASAAMAAGALELVPRPVLTGGGHGGAHGWIRRLAQTIRLMAEVPVVTRYAGAEGAALERAWSLAAVGLVASTGGPAALATILGGLPAGLPFPVLVVQHLPPGSLEGLLRWLSGTCRLPVVEARDGETCAPGRVYFSPDDADLRVEAPGVARVSPAAGTFYSSGDALLESLADAWGARAAGAVLSGMGEDGASGLLRIHRAGGITMAQSAASCAVYGMPAAAARCGATRELLEPEAILRRIVELAGIDVEQRIGGGHR